MLGIETSCDETAVAVVEVIEPRTQNLGPSVRVLSNVVASQIKIHAKTGGVVPEVAARVHMEAILPTIERALRKSLGIVTKSYAAAYDFVRRAGEGIDVIAVTAGPGLMTSLLVGVEVARTLSALWKKPLVAVNHLAGHVYANWLGANGREFRSELSQIEFPALCLVVSGGHTELVLMKKHLDFKVIGSTRDDAAGEAFDKVAKMLKLGYPGGPAIAVEAKKFEKIYGGPASGRPEAGPPAIQFPRPMIDSPDFDFSFSGLKTAVLYYLKNHQNYLKSKNYLQQNNVRPDIKMLREILPRICYEFQEAVVEVLVSKTVRAAKAHRVKTVMLGGGVAANKRLRQQLTDAVDRELKTVNCILSPAEYTTDNAAMIAVAGYFMVQKKQFTPWQKLDVDPNWELGKKFKPPRY